MIEFVRQGDAEQIEGWERLGVAPDHTSFNHVRVCNCFVHIFGYTGGRSCFCAQCTCREGLPGGRIGWQFDRERKNDLVLGSEICEISD